MLSPPFRRLLVANRGEIAIRILRTCREMGIEAVAVYSDADVDAPHVTESDHAERIGPAAPASSYLDIGALLAAAHRSGAQAIHPGYGFLAENAAFAHAVEEAGLIFVGPPSATLAKLGDKLAARRAAADAGVPVVPGTLLPLTDDPGAAAERLALEVGFPALLKAAAGGGGRGMRRVERAEEVATALIDASREAGAAFGDGTIYAERLLTPARHVEVQVLGDRHGGLAVLGERDCSVQRRHQKLLEESPSPAVDETIRGALFDAARRVVGTVGFHSAATAEFLLDDQGHHYFLEMNTRLQVEHGVTELVTGLDLVAWQIRIAAGERLGPEVVDCRPRGHAIQARLYAEDPYRDFAPAPGTIGAWEMPDGPGVRVDPGVRAGTALPAEYDPLLAKLLVVAADRPAAIARLRRALDETLIGGVQTDLPFFRWLVDQPGFGAGHYDTGLIPTLWGGGPPPSADELRMAAAVAVAARGAGAARPANVDSRDHDGWATQARREAVERSAR
ncbi:MAG TPA: biotin carboxylase N-terminal domain-containing protein [Candidatus Limnocylindria bacterium]|nr:biotin carboxylase N-terminal domain-containing protein [Candidatus Limnocylindria bacterium]